MTDTVGGFLGDSSLLLHKTQSTFDVRNESEVIALLKLVHQSALEPDVKNHLRDLIFNYRQSQTNDSLHFVADGFAPHNIRISIPEEDKDSQKKAPVPVIKEEQRSKGFGSSRPLPRFVAMKTAETITKPVSWNASEKRNAQASFVPPPIEGRPAAQPSVVSSPAVQEEIEHVADAMPVHKAVKEQASVMPPTAPAYPDPTARIKEIKRVVNEKIGNPINLIDANNEVGRKYMNALLEAMKKSNGGQPQELSAAMDNLENAFKKVQEVIFNGVKSADTMPIQSEQPASTPTQPIAQESVPKEEQPHVFEVNPQRTTAVSDIQAPQSTTQLHEIKEQAPEIGDVQRQDERPKSLDEATVDVKAHDEPAVAIPKSPVVPATRMNDIQSSPKNSSYTPVQTDVHSVAKEKQLQDLMRANHEKEVTTFQRQEALRVAAMDPLMTPEVDAGLHQLLSEWSLFKSSGFFGTGPGGKEHALYKKLAPLPMAAVVAGRYEGATTKIKQNISDTMNGWRYEDGIIHEPSETFEHYLRKVIRDILNKQNASRRMRARVS